MLSNLGPERLPAAQTTVLANSETLMKEMKRRGHDSIEHILIFQCAGSTKPERPPRQAAALVDYSSEL
jgi:hypothetical protein